MLYFACVSKAILAFFCTFFSIFWGLFLVPKSSKIEMGPFGTCFLEAKEGQEVLQGRFLTLPRRSTGFPRGSREPTRVQEGSQDAPKRFPRGSQEAPRRPPGSPRRLQRAANSSKNGCFPLVSKSAWKKARL